MEKQMFKHGEQVIEIEVTQEAYASNRLFFGCFSNAEEGEEYTTEWILRGRDADGERWEVTYHFTETKGEESDADGLPWGDEFIVKIEQI